MLNQLKFKRFLKSPAVKTAGIVSIWVIVIVSIFLFSYLIYLKQTLPDPDSISSRKLNESTKLYDRTGNVVLYDIYSEEKRTVIAWEQIPEHVKTTTLASEDSEFYSHKGLDINGIIRAIIKDIRDFNLSQGGSTITQQLIKTALLGQEKKWSRKIRELMLSIEVEKRFSKDQILWMYLNQIPYGSVAYGVESASRTFFNKPATELDLNEAAILASMIRSPSYYSPFGSHVDELIIRKNRLLDRMVELDYISEEDAETAKNSPLNFQKGRAELLAPHFVLMIKEELIKRYGQDAVESGGLKITTTLDADLQKNAEESVTKYSQINKARYRASNAALVAVDPKSGDVLALVGSSDYFDVANEGNYNVATALRQPGSAFKPFAYANAFRKGYADYTVLFDIKTEFTPGCSPDGNQRTDGRGNACYHPQNYDGRFRGPVTLRQSLSQSLNIPSVKTLYLAGIDDTINLAEKMGITTLEDRERFGLSLVLGGAEVRLIDITSAYGVFANDGIRNPWNLIKKVETVSGQTLEVYRENPNRVLEAQAARLISDILSDNNARSGVFGLNSPLYIAGSKVAAKTGTTQNNRDAWVIGYTPNISVGVWTGNNNNTPMTAAGAGISASGPLWHEFMTEALDKYPAESFIPPEPVATDKPGLNGRFPELHSILYYVDVKNPSGPIPSNPYEDPQFNNWEWSATHYISLGSPDLDQTPAPTP